jgi:hypothetical protein
LGLVSILAAGLAFGGYLYPLLPSSAVAAWVEWWIPKGTTYRRALESATAHGWKYSSGADHCVAGADGAQLTLELGHLWLVLPAVSYVYARFEFDRECRLSSLQVEKQTDAP